MPHEQPHLNKDHASETRKGIINSLLADRKVRQAANALLRKQLTCGNLCMNCAEACQELVEWEKLA